MPDQLEIQRLACRDRKSEKESHRELAKITAVIGNWTLQRNQGGISALKYTTTKKKVFGFDFKAKLSQKEDLTYILKKPSLPTVKTVNLQVFLIFYYTNLLINNPQYPGGCFLQP